MMVRRQWNMVLALAGLWLGACSELPTTPTSAVVSMTASPSPATAATSSDANFTWGTSFSVTLKELGGVGATVGTITVKVQQSSGGIIVVPPAGTAEAYKFEVKPSGNRLEANGTTSIGFDVVYTLPNAGKEALVTVTVSLTDDKQITSAPFIQVRVT